VYLIEDADGLTIIDTSIGSATPKILKQLATINRKPSDVKRILITHAHPDHVGGLPELKKATGAEVICSAIERPITEGKAEIPRAPVESLSPLSRRMLPPPTTLSGTPVDRELQDGDLLPEVMGGLQAILTPGHAPGHTAYWQPQKRILFCGDVIMRLPHLRLPFAAFTVDMAENKRSIRKAVVLKPAIVCFGHGNPLMQNTAETIEAFAKKVNA
jgi:glyoxylase-like metal-dependent hydrolase (beta-lactamase superfamily II)